MSLVGYKAKNHRQQVSKRGARPEIDERAITLEDFGPLHERFRFTIDAAATAENARLPRFWTAEDNGLDMTWAEERVWCNPPHSNVRPWVEKAWAAGGKELAVLLVPANRTEQAWWQELVEPYRDGRTYPGCDVRVEFLPGRMRFLAPHADSIKPNERPPYGCCLLIWEG
jgi:phage N-6-adenine-methyltransferase